MLPSLARIAINLYDLILDLAFCGQSLQKCVDRKDKVLGYTSSQSCRYFILESIFKHLSLTTNDEFLDVGCGQGRVFAFLLHKKTNWHLTGIDSNKLALDVCQKWSNNRGVKTIEKDVFFQDISSYTIFFLGHPFDKQGLLRFICKIENEVKKEIIVIMVLDLESGIYLANRDGWNIIWSETIYKYYGLQILPKSNRYTIYSYKPKHENN